MASDSVFRFGSEQLTVGQHPLAADLESIPESVVATDRCRDRLSIERTDIISNELVVMCSESYLLRDWRHRIRRTGGLSVEPHVRRGGQMAVESIEPKISGNSLFWRSCPSLDGSIRNHKSKSSPPQRERHKHSHLKINLNRWLTCRACKQFLL